MRVTLRAGATAIAIFAGVAFNVDIINLPSTSAWSSVGRRARGTCEMRFIRTQVPASLAEALKVLRSLQTSSPELMRAEIERLHYDDVWIDGVRLLSVDHWIADAAEKRVFLVPAQLNSHAHCKTHPGVSSARTLAEIRVPMQEPFVSLATYEGSRLIAAIPYTIEAIREGAAIRILPGGKHAIIIRGLVPDGVTGVAIEINKIKTGDVPVVNNYFATGQNVAANNQGSRLTVTIDWLNSADQVVKTMTRQPYVGTLKAKFAP